MKTISEMMGVSQQANTNMYSIPKRTSLFFPFKAALKNLIPDMVRKKNKKSHTEMPIFNFQDFSNFKSNYADSERSKTILEENKEILTEPINSPSLFEISSREEMVNQA